MAMEMANSCSSILGSGFKCMYYSSSSLKNTKTLSDFRGFKHTHGSFQKCLHFPTQRSSKMVVGPTRMVSDAYVGSSSSTTTTSIRFNSKNFTKLDSCLVVAPTPYRSKPRAIIKFLGGAFIGAIPEVTYGYLIEFLAREGFLVVVVPYYVTFDHSQAAKLVYERFNTCLDTLLSSGLSQANLSPAQVRDLPLFSVGHSNGALLQLLTGSYFSEKIPKANVIISYNNRPATEAVPYFEQLGPAVSQMMPVVEATQVYSIARNASDAWKVILDTVGSIFQESEQDFLNSLTKFIDQLPSVMNEVTEGVSEFKPTPSENRDCFKSSYNVEHTLLVKFNLDTIDETDILEETLKPRVDSFGGTLEKVQLNGNHVTPCIQELRWEVGQLYTPTDAVAQGIISLTLNDTRTLARTISSWFRRFEN